MRYKAHKDRQSEKPPENESVSERVSGVLGVSARMRVPKETSAKVPWENARRHAKEVRKCVKRSVKKICQDRPPKHQKV